MSPIAVAMNLVLAALLLSVSAWHLRHDGESADPAHRKVAGLAKTESCVALASRNATEVAAEIEDKRSVAE